MVQPRHNKSTATLVGTSPCNTSKQTLLELLIFWCIFVYLFFLRSSTAVLFPSSILARVEVAMLAVAVPGAQRVIVRQVRRQRPLWRVGGFGGCFPAGEVGCDAAGMSRRWTTVPVHVDGVCPTRTAGRLLLHPKSSRYAAGLVAVVAGIDWMGCCRRCLSWKTHTRLKCLTCRWSL